MAQHFKRKSTINTLKSAQVTVNDRLKFLINSLNLSVRAFSTTLGVPDTNTRNYLDKGTKLNSDYLERIAHHFKNINLIWLITGEGEPFLPGTAPDPNLSIKKVKGNVVGTNHGTITHTTLPDCEKDLAAARKEIELLNSHLAEKERTIQILLDRK